LDDPRKCFSHNAKRTLTALAIMDRFNEFVEFLEEDQTDQKVILLCIILFAAFLFLLMCEYGPKNRIVYHVELVPLEVWAEWFPLA